MSCGVLERSDSMKELGKFFIGVLIGSMVTTIILPKPQQFKGKIITYEYAKQCQCGETIEGYHSLVDGYVIEECKSCGYHIEK